MDAVVEKDDLNDAIFDMMEDELKVWDVLQSSHTPQSSMPREINDSCQVFLLTLAWGAHSDAQMAKL